MYLSKYPRPYQLVFTPLQAQQPCSVTLRLPPTDSTQATWPHWSPGYCGVIRFAMQFAVGVLVTVKFGFDEA
jgi:hypothetical protein